MRNIRPALPALILLLSAAGLGVPASSAQSKGTAKKKPSASSAKTESAKPSLKASAKPAASKAPLAKGPSTKTNVSGSSAKPTAHSGNARSGKKSSARSRRQPGQKAPTSDRVSEIQAALAKDGSFAGMPNGKWDDDTVRAMRKFQAAHGLNPTGRLDALSLQRLGLGSQTAGVAAPIPPPGAVSRLTSSVVTTSSSTETARRQ
jgi:peptidoglycan hydrolase-like protein with peptidoglycan-binding domain